MLSGRMLQVLDYLNHNHTATYKKISEILEIKERYVRYDIDKINDYFYLSQLPLIEKKPKGVVVFPDNINISLLLNEDNFIYSSKERISLILLILLFDDKFLKMNQLSQDFQVSRSTIKKDMSDLSKELYYSHLEIEYTDCFHIVGDEKNFLSLKIYELSKYIYLFQTKETNFNSYESYAFHIITRYFSDVPLKNIMAWIHDILKNNLDLNDEDYNYFTANILLLCESVINQKPIPTHMGFDAALGFNKYFEQIHSLEDIVDNKITHHYRGCLIRLLEYIDNYDGLYGALDSLRIQGIITQLLDAMSKRLDVDFNEDSLLMEGLTNHMIPLIKRTFTKRMMYHNVKVVIPTNDQYIYEALVDSLNDVDILNVIENTDEKVYLAVHFIMSMRRLLRLAHKRIVIVCNYGYGSSTMLKETLLNEFQVKVVDIIPLYKLSTFENLNHIDYIVSTLPIKNTYGKKNIIVNPLLTEQDYKKLKEAGIEKKKVKFDYYSLNSKLNFLEEKERQMVMNVFQEELGYHIPKLSKHSYKVSDLLKEECIMIENQKLNWDDAILKSSQLLENKGIVANGYGDKIINEIEKTGFYCVTDGLFALFHGKVDENVYESGISLLINRHVMSFNDKKVKIVFCLASKDQKDQIPAMILLMRIVKKTGFLKLIENAKTADEALEILHKCEGEVM